MCMMSSLHDIESRKPNPGKLTRWLTPRQTSLSPVVVAPFNSCRGCRCQLRSHKDLFPEHLEPPHHNLKRASKWQLIIETKLTLFNPREFRKVRRGQFGQQQSPSQLPFGGASEIVLHNGSRVAPPIGSSLMTDRFCLVDLHMTHKPSPKFKR